MSKFLKRYKPNNNLKYGLISYWNLNENTYDSIGGVNGISSGATLTESGYYFDGVDDYINFGDVQAFDGITKISISAWIYPTESRNQGILTKYDTSTGSSNLMLAFAYNINNITLTLYSDGNNYISCNVGETRYNDWIHVVFCYDFSEQTFKCVIDGQEKLTSKTTVGTPPTSFININASLYIGAFQGFISGLLKNPFKEN